MVLFMLIPILHITLSHMFDINGWIPKQGVFPARSLPGGRASFQCPAGDSYHNFTYWISYVVGDHATKAYNNTK